jgi:hypothetical protein
MVETHRLARRVLRLRRAAARPCGARALASFCRGPRCPHLLAGRDPTSLDGARRCEPAAFLLLASTVTIGGAIASLFTVH